MKVTYSYVHIGAFPFCQKNYYVIVEAGTYINDSQCINPPDTSTFCIFLTQWLWAWSSDLLWTMWHHQTWPKQRPIISLHVGICPPGALLLPYNAFLEGKTAFSKDPATPTSSAEPSPQVISLLYAATLSEPKWGH